MTELTFALLKYGFLILLWIFIWLAVRSLRKDIETFSPRPSRARRRREREVHKAKAETPQAAAPRPHRQPSTSASSAASAQPTLLVIIDGPLAGSSVPLAEADITLGRAASNTVVLDDEFVSSHHARVYRDTLEALRNALAACRCPVFIAPGNHDALLPGSPYLENGWPENVHIFRTAEPERVSLPELDVYGAGFLRAEMPAMLDGFRAADPSRLNILVLHGDAENPASPYDPVSSAALAASGLDYAALGHIHRRGERRDGGTLCAWPGCLMGRGFDECGEKGALLVSAEKGACRTEFVPCGARRYERLSVPAGDDALAAVRAALTPELEGSCCRIELTGEAAPVDLAALQAALEAQFFSLDLRDRTRPKQDLWEACGEDTLRGHFLDGLHAQFEAAETDERRQVVARAARLGLALMDGREVPL